MSQFRVAVDYLTISGNTAIMSGLVEEATGYYANAGGPYGIAGMQPGDRVTISASDNPDGIAFAGVPVPISSSNITVHQS